MHEHFQVVRTHVAAQVDNKIAETGTYVKPADLSRVLKFIFHSRQFRSVSIFFLIRPTMVLLGLTSKNESRGVSPKNEHSLLQTLLAFLCDLPVKHLETGIPGTTLAGNMLIIWNPV